MEYLEGLNLTSHCNQNYSIQLLEQYNLTWSVTSIVSFFLTLGILLFILFHQSYGSILQRLFIYFILSIMAYLAASATDLQLQPRFFLGDTVCKWTGYSKTATFVITLVFSCEISLYLLYIMYYQIRQKQLPQLSTSQNVVIELGLSLIAVVIPPLLLVIPRDYFGLSGALCWVKSFEHGSEICQAQNGSMILEWVIVAVYTSFSVFSSVSYTFLVGIFCWLACKSQSSRKQYQNTAMRTIFLVSLLILSAIIHIITILVTLFLVDKHGKLHNVWAVFAMCVTPLAQCIRPIAYMFYLNSVKKFRWESTRNTAVRWKSTGKSCCRGLWKKLGLSKGRFAVNSAYSEMSDANLNNHQSEYYTPTLTSSLSQYGSLAKTSVE